MKVLFVGTLSCQTINFFGTEEEKVRRGNPKSFLCRQGLNVISRMGRFVEYSVFGREVTCDWSIISITPYFHAEQSVVYCSPSQVIPRS